MSGISASKLIVVNVLSTGCFLSAGLIFFLQFRSTNDILYFVFSLASLLFFESELLFAFSNIWNMTWWYWHLIKLMIFVGLSIGLAHGLIRTFRDLYESRQKLSATVDELKQAYDHLKNTQEELLESEKLASIGKMAAVISHEIRNPLAAIKNSAGIFKRHALLSSEDRELLGHHRQGDQQAGRLHHGFSGIREAPPPADDHDEPERLIEETTALLSHYDMSGGSLQIVRTLDPRLPDLRLDRNAMKTGPLEHPDQCGAGDARGRTPDDRDLLRNSAAERSHRARATIAVSDTGRGMSAGNDTKRRSSPFSPQRPRDRTGAVHRGTRYQSSTAAVFVVESMLDRGTTVCISCRRLPKQQVTAGGFEHVVHIDS